jgi:hypothetical protein
MDAMDALFWAGVVWGPSLVLMAFLLIPLPRKHAD